MRLIRALRRDLPRIGLDPAEYIAPGRTDPGQLRFTAVSTIAMIVLLMHIIDGKSKRVKIDVKSKCLSMLIHMADKSLEAFGRYPVGHMLSATSGGITVSIGANGIVNNFGAMLSRCGDPAYALWNTLTDHQVLGLHERGGMGPGFEIVCFCWLRVSDGMDR